MLVFLFYGIVFMVIVLFLYIYLLYRFMTILKAGVWGGMSFNSIYSSVLLSFTMTFNFANLTKQYNIYTLQSSL